MKNKDKDKDKTKRKKPCVPLDEGRSIRLAMLIISLTERNVRHGTDREERITAPSGAVVLF